MGQDAPKMPYAATRAALAEAMAGVGETLAGRRLLAGVRVSF